VRFDVILTNPPFQDSAKRGRTPHKLWIDFTRAVFDRLLVDGGMLCQVSPASFRSPSNRVLELMKANCTSRIRFDTERYFPDVASTFSHYTIVKAPNDGSPTRITTSARQFDLHLDSELFYLPRDVGPEALSIHRKVVFHPQERLAVERDYVTCHNILLRTSDTLSKTRTDRHLHPVLHTNRQVWYSSIRQEFAGDRKVMWSRSGYTRPVYDDGVHGGTDMVYFVRVADAAEGRCLEHNLNLQLMRYVYATARWSGFGNEKVFHALPALPRHRTLDDDDLFAMFGLTGEEVAHVRSTLAAGRMPSP
jgi:hypothetical protein